MSFWLGSFYSCEKTVQEPNIDTIPPQATIIYPSDGEHVSGEIIIQIRSVDNQATDYVEFYINQEKIHTDSTSSDNDIFTYRWNTMALIDSKIVFHLDMLKMNTITYILSHMIYQEIVTRQPQ